MDVSDVLADLLAEQQALDDIAAGLDADQWKLPTPSPGWTIADQVGHLTYFEGTAALAIVDPPAFQDAMTSLLSSGGAGAESADDIVLGPYRAMSAEELLAAWRANRAALAAAGETLENDTRIAWYGPSMGAKSFLTARLMEVWAHGQDIVDTLRASGVAVERPATDRLRHIAQLGTITRRWSYLNRGMEAPEGEVSVLLTAPSGDTWSWGPDDPASADGRVTGPAEDFCLVVTQRRHLDDTALQVDGEIAHDWLLRAQAFAGPATDGPAPSTAPTTDPATDSESS
jgi:uncharacterized protein (TIGR03084 family)